MFSFFLALPLLPGCAQDDHTELYKTTDVAPSLSWEDLQTLDHLGPSLLDSGVNFSLYSESAERIELLLFDDPEADLPTWRIPMAHDDDALWNVHVEGLGVGQHYGYIAWGPNWPHDESCEVGSTTGFLTDVDANGNRFNPNKPVSYTHLTLPTICSV